MSAPYILIVEDEPKIAHLLRDYLRKNGYNVICVSQGDHALAQIRRQEPQLMLLDIMLPQMDGLEVCRQVRKFSSLPIIMLTARVEELDRILGLEIGADDYICKPFSPREVVARVKAVLRRSLLPEIQRQLVAGPVVLDELSREVKINDVLLRLTPSEFDLLRVLMSFPNRVFSRSELVNHIQGYDFDGYERTIDSHIKNLRKKMAEILQEEWIISIYGVGYKLNDPHK
ncbi:MAG: response regulator [SAR324 cluster bacterium]|nr:response regulator [SAR324 cluster bacterium]